MRIEFTQAAPAGEGWSADLAEAGYRWRKVRNAHEIRWSHPTGATVRLFYAHGDDTFDRLYAYPAGNTDKPTGGIYPWAAHGSVVQRSNVSHGFPPTPAWPEEAADRAVWASVSREGFPGYDRETGELAAPTSTGASAESGDAAAADAAADPDATDPAAGG